MIFPAWLKDLFVPGGKNNYRARILHPSFLSGFIFLFLLSQTLISFIALLRPGVLGYSSDITPERVIQLTNDERIRRGLKPLKNDASLNEAALRKAGDMFAFDYWAHQSPSGREPWSFLKEVGYDYRVAGENLARDFYDADSAVEAWMKSQTHRENILNPKFSEIGISVVDGTLGGISTTLIVQLFGTKAGSSIYAEASEPGQEPVFTVPIETEEPVFDQSEGVSLAALAEGERLPINPLYLTKLLGVFLFGLVVVALLIDGYFVFKKKIYRSTGRTTSHAIFLAVMFFLILLSGSQGLVN
ncbi:MAG: CAP domain-containing protein [Patescibacteria group bacterium]